MSNTKEAKIKEYMEKYGATETEARVLYAYYYEADEEKRRLVRQLLKLEPAEEPEA